MHQRLVELVQAADFGTLNLKVDFPGGVEIKQKKILAEVETMYSSRLRPAGPESDLRYLADIFGHHLRARRLLHPPLADEVLDRDEVWFVEKGETGASTLYPLSDFKPRREDNLERRYLAGQYGAVLDYAAFDPGVERAVARAARLGPDNPATDVGRLVQAVLRT
jgi:hypothetical protein